MLEILHPLSCDFIFLGDFNLNDEDFSENGKTFQENAREKAKYYSLKMDKPALGEDSGIIVDALEGELGVYTKRWGLGEYSSDKEWVEFFLEEIKNEKNRNAKFSCCASFYYNGKFFDFFGETKGKIADKLLAPIIPGLPLSSCFLPEKSNQVYAEMGAEEKNKISHRGKAIRKFFEFLKKEML